MRTIVTLGVGIGVLIYSTLWGVGWLNERITLRNAFAQQDMQIWHTSHRRLELFQQQYGNAPDENLPIADRTIRSALRARIEEVETRHPEWRTSPPR